jgi:hypothetical protein
MDDEDLMSRLREINAQVDRVPELVVESGRAAFLTRRLDDELAELLLDSSAATGEVRGVQEDVRLLSFQHDDVSLEVQVGYSDDQATVTGFVDGASEVVELELGGGVLNLPIDSYGRLSTQVPLGAIRFRLRRPEGTAVVTNWVLL